MTRGSAGAVAATPTQRQIWYADQIAVGKPVYHLGVEFSLHGPLARQDLLRSVSDIADRHDILRSVFELSDDGLVHMPLDDGALDIVEHDLRALPPAGKVKEAARRVRDEFHRPFDLARRTPLRVALVRLGEQEHILLIAFHHIAVDAVSVGIFCRELEELYNARCSGLAVPSWPRPAQYAQLAAEASPGGGRLRQDSDYWMDRLAGLNGATRWPTDRPEPQRRSFAGAHHRFTVPADTARAVVAHGRAAGASPFMTFLAVWNRLLALRTGLTDIVVGAPAISRLAPGSEGALGPFLQILPLRTGGLAGGDFGTVLAATRETVLGAFDHQEMSVEPLLRDAGIRGRGGIAALIGSTLDVTTSGPPALDLAGLRCTGREVIPETAKFDLSLEILYDGDSCEGRIEYSTDVYDAPTIAVIGEDMNALLDDCRPAPHTGGRPAPGGAVPAPDRTPLPVAELVRRLAADRPDAPAVTDGGTTLTYALLEARASALAGLLRERGVGPETPVPILASRTTGMVVAQYAVLKAGGAFMPLAPDTPQERLRSVLDSVGAPVVLIGGGTRPLPPGAPPSVDVDAPGAWEGHAPYAASPHDLDGAAYVMHTSGSTGVPNGVVVTHRGLANLVSWHHRAFRVTRQDRASHMAGLGFDAAVWELWPYLAAGAEVVLVNDRARTSPEALLSFMASHGITIGFVPTPLAEIAIRPGLPNVPTLRVMLTGGDRLVSRPEPGARYVLHNNYGPTENTVCATSCPVATRTSDGRGDTETLPSIGRPIDNVRVYVLDPLLQPVPAGEPGELFLAGESLARGYLGKPALTSERFLPDCVAGRPGDRMYRTGDLVRLAGGRYHYLGRVDEQVKIHGQRVEPGDIEAALRRQQGVREAAVALHRDPNGSPRLVGFIVADAAAPTEVELRRALRRRLAPHMIPARIVVLDEIPLTRNGKIDRAKLRSLPVPAAAPPMSPALRESDGHDPWATVIARAMADVLDLPSVAPDSDFFDIGGDSMLSLSVIRLAGRHGVPLTAADVYTHPTATALAKAARDATALRQDEPVPARPVEAPADPGNLPPGATDAYPASSLQTGMFFTRELTGVRTAYHQYSSYVVHRRLDRDALQQAVDLLVHQHPALRTSFNFSGYAEPMQIVHGTPTLTVGNATSANGAAPPREHWRRWLAEQLTRPLDERSTPLARIDVLDLGDSQFQLLLLFHHAIIDSWSLQTLLRQLDALYARLLRGDRVELPPVNRALAEFVRLERLSAESAAAREFWRAELSGAPQAPLFPAATGAGPAADTAGRLEWPLPTALAEALRQVARLTVCPLKTVLLAAHVRVIASLSGERDVVTGLIGHARPEGEDGLSAVGLFLNTVPLRVQTKAAPDPDLPRKVRAAEARVMPHRRYPLPRILRAGSLPSLDSAFAFVRSNVSLTGPKEGDAGWEFVAEHGGASMPLAASFLELLPEGRLSLQLSYDPAAVPVTAEDLVDRYRTQLQIVGDGSR